MRGSGKRWTAFLIFSPKIRRLQDRDTRNSSGRASHNADGQSLSVENFCDVTEGYRPLEGQGGVVPLLISCGNETTS